MTTAELIALTETAAGWFTLGADRKYEVAKLLADRLEAAERERDHVHLRFDKAGAPKGTTDERLTWMLVQLDKRDFAEAAEDVLRSLACSLSVGGYNAETVDAKVFEKKINDGIDMLTKPLLARAEAAERERDALLGNLGEAEERYQAAESRATSAEASLAARELTAEEREKANWIALDLGTGRNWHSDDWREFYRKDVTFLLALIDRLTGSPPCAK